MRLEHGTIILESAFNQNITFWARGRGSVNMHTETGIYSLSHQMVGSNTDMITRLESLEQNMRNSLALADQLTALREQVQEIVRMIFDRCHTGSFAQNFFQTIFVVYELNSFWQKEKALNYSAPEWGAIIEE